MTFRLGEYDEFGGVHFVNEGREITETMAAVGDDGKSRVSFVHLGNGIEHRGGNRAHFARASLIHDNEHIELRCEDRDAVDELSLHVGRSRRAIDDIESGEFLGRSVGAMEQGLGIGEGLSFGGGLKMGEIDTGHATERAAQFEPFTVVAAVADGEELLNPKGGEISSDISGGPGLAAHLADLMNGQAGFDGGLGLRGIDIEIAIEREIADDTGTERIHLLKQRIEAVGTHGAAGNRKRAVAAIVLCIFGWAVHTESPWLQ